MRQGSIRKARELEYIKNICARKSKYPIPTLDKTKNSLVKQSAYHLNDRNMFFSWILGLFVRGMGTFKDWTCFHSGKVMWQLYMAYKINVFLRFPWIMLLMRKKRK